MEQNNCASDLSNPARRLNRPSYLTIAVLVIYAALRIWTLVFPNAPTHSSNIATLSGRVFQSVQSFDYDAKSAARNRYFAFDKPSSRKPLSNLVGDANDLVVKYPDDPSLAYRLIVVRGLDPSRSPLAPVLDRRNRIVLANPLVSFDRAAAAQPSSRDELMKEKATWEAVFSLGERSPLQAKQVASAIKALPIRPWYRSLACAENYRQAHNKYETSHWLAVASRQGRSGLVAFALVGVAMFAILATGIVILFRMALDLRRQDADTLPADCFPRPAPLPASERTLGFGDLLDVFGVYLFVQIALSLLPLFLMRHMHVQNLSEAGRQALIGREIVTDTVAYVASAGAAFCYLVHIARRKGGDWQREIGFNFPRSYSSVRFGLATYAISSAAIIFTSLMGNKLFGAAPEPPNPFIPMLVSSSHVWEWVTLAVLAVIAAPIAEETMFRGVLLTSIRQKLGAAWAIVISGLIFGMIHPVGLVEGLALSSLGCVFGLIAVYRRSIAPTMVAHGLNNLVATASYFAYLAVILPPR